MDRHPVPQERVCKESRCVEPRGRHNTQAGDLVGYSNCLSDHGGEGWQHDYGGVSVAPDAEEEVGVARVEDQLADVGDPGSPRTGPP